MARSQSDADALLHLDKTLAAQDAIHFPDLDARVEVPLVLRDIFES